MQETFRGFSRGLYSNWLWHKPLQLLIDAGEGLQLALGSNVFSPSLLAITHGHSDHVLGLAGFLAARKFGKGATDKPLTIVFPEGSVGVQAVREYLGRAYADVIFPINWIAAAPGTSVPLGKNKHIEAITVRHTSNEVALGYRVIEARKRLKPQFASMPQADIEAAARQGGRDDLLEDVRHIVFAHSGDAMPIDASVVTDADVLVHDATFLNEPDRREPIHATTEEAIDVARRANVKALVLYHLSIRYDRATAIPALRAQVAASGFAGECWLLDEDAFVPLS
ncbi:MAG TPA: MBL fold metallo-hydrolase [Vicinamibacterales bacterium]